MLKQNISLKDPQIKLVLITLAIITGTYMFYHRIIAGPLKSKEFKLKNQLEHFELQNKIGKMYNEISTLEASLAPQNDTSWLRMQIIELTRKTGCDITSIEPLPDKEIPSYKFISFKIKAKASYNNILRFLKLIENNPYLIVVENLKLTPPRISRAGYDNKEEIKIADVEIIIGTLYLA